MHRVRKRSKHSSSSLQIYSAALFPVQPSPNMTNYKMQTVCVGGGMLSRVGDLCVTTDQIQNLQNYFSTPNIPWDVQ